LATICDVVPLNVVNHRLASYGVEALMRSQRPVLKELLAASAVDKNMDEKDVGFRLGPRINAVGRLEHADKVIQAFVEENPSELIQNMGLCNDKRKLIQAEIVIEADELAKNFPDDPILFLGGDWHPGVVGIAASKIAEDYWRPVWMYEKKDGQCKGSSRSIPGFDVTDAMTSVKELFTKFGGHAAAGGFSFPVENEQDIRKGLIEFAENIKKNQPEVWQSKVFFDCSIPVDLATLDLVDCLDSMKPFGHGFEEPRFSLLAQVEKVDFYNDKVTGEPRHTAVTVSGAKGRPQKVMFFNRVCQNIQAGEKCEFLVTASKNTWRGSTSLSLMALDYRL
jgi:single-stranded-DNA-specific exonuclease